MNIKTKEQSMFLIDKKKKKKEIYCQNCGKYGHAYKKCNDPITSLGIIAFRRTVICVKSEKENNKVHTPYTLNDLKESNELIKNPGLYSNNIVQNNNESIQYLLIRRRDSLSYVEFIRGRYSIDDLDFIYTMFNEMTKNEREKIKNESFESLWNFLWMNKSNNNFKVEYEISYNKFLKINEGYFVDIQDSMNNNRFINLDIILQETESIYDVPEWGFAKGRRNNRERDLDCAEREFQEETGFRKGEYNIIHQLDKIDEVFIGSNKINYKHTYFIAHCPYNKTPIINQNNKHQAYEVGDIGWFTFDECYKIFRPCDVEKKELLVKVHNVLRNLKFTEEDVKII